MSRTVAQLAENNWRWIGAIISSGTIVVAVVSWMFTIERNLSKTATSSEATESLLKVIARDLRDATNKLNDHEKRITINEREIEHLKGKSK